MLRDRQKLAMIMAEFLGTAILTVTALSVLANLSNPIFVALGLGLTLAALYMMFSRVPGAHFNPAITLGMLTTRRIPVLPAVVYVAAQLLGGMVGYGLYTYLLNQDIKTNNTFDSRLLVSEALGAFVFSMGWAATVYNRYTSGRAAFVLGGSLAVGILVASFLGTGIINPALALGMHSWVWGTFVLGPVLGAIIGFNLYALLFAPAAELRKDEDLDGEPASSIPAASDEPTVRTRPVRRKKK